jgi:hypothetical protein
MRSKSKDRRGKAWVDPQSEALLVFSQEPKGWIVVYTNSRLKDLKFPARKKDIEKLTSSRHWFIEYRPRPVTLFDMTLSKASEPRRIPVTRLLEMAPVTVFDDEKEFVRTMGKAVGTLSTSVRATEIRQSWSGKLAGTARPPVK